jgi:hypothetical protein
MPNLDDLFTTPPAELISNLQALRNERAVIERKERMLEQLLEMLTEQGGVLADEIAALGAANAIGPLREQIRQVLLSIADESALRVPKVVYEELVARGNRSVSIDNVRMTMKRMADADELARPDPDTALYGLPDAEGLDEALAGFQAIRQTRAAKVAAKNGKAASK